MFRRQLILMCLFILAMPSIGWCQTPPKIAVLAGVNRYQHSDLNQPKSLEYAENDVKAMKEVLEQSGYKVYLLLGKEATRDAIDKTLQKARKDTGDGGVFLIGFAGHGFQPEKGDQAYFCPFDTDKKALPKEGEDPWDYKTMMPLSNVLGYMKSSPATSRVLLMDACRNDPVAGRGRGVGTNLKIADIPNTAVFLSCSAGQKSFEDKVWGGGHGVFFHHVLSGLRGDPMVQKNGKLNLDLLWSYLEEEVPAQVKKVAKDPFSGTAPNQEPYRLVNGKVDLQILAKAGSGVIPKMVPKIEPKDSPTIGTNQPKPGEERSIDLGGGVKMVFCWIPPGKATLGGDPELKDNPEHEYEEKRGFWMAKYHVTQEQWVQVMKNHPKLSKNPSYFIPSEEHVKEDGITDTSRFPVDRVSWNDCQEFLKELNKQVNKAGGLGKTFALPHEDQWEYAYRGGKGNKQAFYWGNSLNGDKANVNGNYPYGTTVKGAYKQRTTEVGEYEKVAPHPWGLCDMSGNVCQWCENLYSEKSANRVLRGGSWIVGTYYMRAAYRGNGTPDNSSDVFGFRVVVLP